MYFLPLNYYNSIGFYSDLYDKTYYNGYGFNFYYKAFRYYQDSRNRIATTGWILWTVLTPIITVLSIGLICFVTELNKRTMS